MKKRVQQVTMISCIGPQADTQKVFSSKLLHEHSRDIPDKEWKMEFIRNRNNEAEYNPCITNRSSFQSLYYDEHQWKTVYSTQLYHGMEFFFLHSHNGQNHKILVPEAQTRSRYGTDCGRDFTFPAVTPVST